MNRRKFIGMSGGLLFLPSLNLFAVGFSNHPLLQPGTFTLVCGRPGIGKTHFATQVVTTAMRKGMVGTWVSLEMSEGHVFGRLMSMYKNHPNGRKLVNREALVGYHQPGTPMWDDIAPLQRIEYRSNVSFRELWDICLESSSRGQLDYLIVDYIQLMADRELAVRKFKELAKHFHVPVIGLFQVPRGWVSFVDKMPILSRFDLHGTKPDIALFLNRSAHQQKDDKGGTLRLIKNRQGGVELTRFPVLQQDFHILQIRFKAGKLMTYYHASQRFRLVVE